MGEYDRVLADLQSTIQATISTSDALLDKVHRDDDSLDMSEGISLLLLRPQLLLTMLQDLVIMTAWRLLGHSESAPIAPVALHTISELELASIVTGDIISNQELFDKVRGLEGKLEYQIKKLVGLAESREKQEEPAEEDPLSFRPNPSALLSTKPVRERVTEDPEVYRPPRIAAVPYAPERRRSDRRAPALLSEFADTMNGAPVLESTTGLSTRPVQNRHTNSISAKRAAELERMNKFEEENMTRLVTNKRDAKRRREDEEALALGYGVGGPARSRGRRQNGLEAELEGVLGDRRAKGVWENVKSDRGGIMERVRASKRRVL